MGTLQASSLMELFLKRGSLAVLWASKEASPVGRNSAGAKAGWQEAWQSHEGNDIGSDDGGYEADSGKPLCKLQASGLPCASMLTCFHRPDRGC